jgi:hypothetical protein
LSSVSPVDSLTIRISRSTHEILRSLSDTTGLTMAAVVDLALRDFRRKRFWDDYHAAYAELRADPDAWSDFQRELEPWAGPPVEGLGGPP